MNQSFKRTITSLSVTAAFSLSLSACSTVGPDFKGTPTLPVKEGQAFRHADFDKPEPVYQQSEPASVWWQQLNDATLNALIDKALANNIDIRVALANVTAARSVLIASKTNLQPNLDLSGSITPTRNAYFQEGGDTDQTLDDNVVTSAGLGLSWEIDVFGRIKRSIEAAKADIAYAEALRDDVKRIVIADVAQAYIELRGAQVRKEVVTRNIENQQSTLELTMTMLEEGIVSELDTVRARAQLRATESLLPTLKSNEVAAANRLALLSGEAPAQLNIALNEDSSLPTLPDFLAIGDPLDLIRRRPDIRQAEYKLAGLTANVGIVTADLYPTISFGGAIGLTAQDPNDLTKQGAFNYSIGPAISWNLFNREATRARIKQAEANVDAQLARFDGVVLTALTEIDSALVSHVQERNRNIALQESTIASREAVDLVRLRYHAGAESFLGVLDAERTLLEAEQQLTSSDIELAQGLVRVYRALGGGWQTSVQQATTAEE